MPCVVTSLPRNKASKPANDVITCSASTLSIKAVIGVSRSIASAWIYNGEYHDIDVELNRFDSVSLEDIRKVLERFPLTDTTVVAYGPTAVDA